MAGLVLLALIVLMIWAEIEVFVLIGSETGALLVIVGVFATAILGLRLFRKAGMATMRRLHEAAGRGAPPVLELVDGGAITIAAGLLLIPGFITDALGFVLFVPGLRTMITLGLLRFLFSLVPGSGFLRQGGFEWPGRPGGESRESGKAVPDPENPSDATIDGEFERKD